MRLRILGCALLVLLAAPRLQAHAFAPALLELRETAAERYDAHWRSALLRVRGAALTPVWPAGCVHTVTATAVTDDALQQSGQLHCPGGLVGRELGVDGLARSGSTVILRVQFADGGSVQTLLDARTSRHTLARAAAGPVAPRYFGLGVEHLLLGFDHVLLVLAFMLLIRGARRLAGVITAFTLGHSLTLGLAVLGFIGVPQALTEFAIAISLLLLATLLVRPGGAPAPAARAAPWRLALVIGLLHGLGFAGALAQIGLPEAAVAPALLAFNLGIEAGQLGLIAALLALTAALRPLRARLPRAPAALPAYAIGICAGYWSIERAVALVS